MTIEPHVPRLLQSPGTARCPVSMVNHGEVVLEYFLRRGYIPAGETCALGSLFTARSYLAAAADTERMKQKLHTIKYTTALGASHRPVYYTPCKVFKLLRYPCFFDVITTYRSCCRHPRLNYRPAGRNDNSMYHAVLSQQRYLFHY